MTQQRGLFITFEGPDGGGKSSQVRRIANTLKQNGYNVVTTREPGGTRVGDKLREIILDPAHKGMEPVAEAFLYAAARAQHVAEVIRPAVEDGKIVLCDRYVDSSIVYQGYGRGLPIDFVREINRMATEGLVPDLTILLDLPVEIGLMRAKKGGILKGDRLEREKVEFHERVRQGYLRLAQENPGRFRLVDASQSIEDVYQCVIQLMRQFGLKIE